MLFTGTVIDSVDTLRRTGSLYQSLRAGGCLSSDTVGPRTSRASTRTISAVTAGVEMDETLLVLAMQ